MKIKIHRHEEFGYEWDVVDDNDNCLIGAGYYDTEESAIQDAVKQILLIEEREK